MAGEIRTNAAASMLGVSPNTLRSWERRFGFPSPRRTTGGHRQFDLNEIEALRSALAEAPNISSAISLAQERGAGPSTPLRLTDAINRFDETACDRILEESLSVRSVERTIAEVLPPGVDDSGHGAGSPEHEFAWRYASRWMSATMRVAPPATRSEGVLVFDASGPAETDALHTQALELVLRRAGLRTLSLGAQLQPARLASALNALQPRLVILSGKGASLDAIGRLVYAARQVGGSRVTVMNFRGALPTTGASTVQTLDDSVALAREQILAALERPAAASEPRFEKPAAVVNA